MSTKKADAEHKVIASTQSNSSDTKDSQDTKKEQAWEAKWGIARPKSRLHRLNVVYPWLKFVVGVVLVSALVGGIVIARTVTGSDQTEPPIISEEGGEGTGETGEGVNGSEPDTEDSDGDNTGEPEDKPPTEEPSAKSPTGVEENTVKPSDVTGKKLIALTFDDGPSAATTPRLLEILREKNVKATFFVVGNMAQRSPDLVRAEVAAGHEVGSHTTGHQNLKLLSAEGVKAEVAEMDRIFMEILGKPVPFVRPPYGNLNDIVRTNIGQPMILWTIDPEDWKVRDAATVRARVVEAAFDGAVILVHDIHASTIEAVPGMIDDLRAQGYEFLTISELAKVRGVNLENGAAYGSFRP